MEWFYFCVLYIFSLTKFKDKNLINALSTPPGTFTTNYQLRRNSSVLWAWLGVILAFSCFISWMLIRGASPFSVIGWIIFFAGIAALFYEPRYGVYQIIGFSLAGDMILTPWFPFVKNLSSAESILYIGRATSFSPAEIYIVLTFISWLSRVTIQEKTKIFKGPIFWPAIIFSFFITTGLIYGLIHQGDKKIALWEVRIIYYLPAMLILTSNLIKNKNHVSKLIWIIIFSIFLDACNGIVYIANILNFNIRSVEAIAEHSFSIHINTIIVLAINVWMFNGSKLKRLTLPLLLPIVLISYFANQRRASFITLAVAIIIISFVLYHIRRKTFWFIIPAIFILSIIYTGLFWNSTSSLGMPARAIRSVISPQRGGRDDSSNIYRVIENINSKFTITQHPFTGVGFGNKFYIIAPMPDISFFEWWQYITHNSILWIWMQTGVFGFISMLMLIGLSIIVGTRSMWNNSDGDLRAIVFTATLYIIMHFVYAYVDMSWEAQSMIYVGSMMGIINCTDHVFTKTNYNEDT